MHVLTQGLITLVFNSPDNLQSQLQFEHDVLLKGPGGKVDIITAARPGLTFDPDIAYKSLFPLSGRVVTQAIAHADGRLEIILDDRTTLEVRPDNYEAWHFQQPAPSIQSSSAEGVVSLTGYGGGLI